MSPTVIWNAVKSCGRQRKKLIIEMLTGAQSLVGVEICV
jgi:hypothetical protein